ncbi:MAG: hypothetical protein KM296_09650, partial [Brockia lithotrophica]|nr:hypothetical protein [Brockia lithotrophica]
MREALSNGLTPLSGYQLKRKLVDVRKKKKHKIVYLGTSDIPATGKRGDLANKWGGRRDLNPRIPDP